MYLRVVLEVSTTNSNEFQQPAVETAKNKLWVYDTHLCPSQVVVGFGRMILPT